MTGVDEIHWRVRDDIAKHGWHAVLVAGDDEGPPFAYTIGLQSTFKHAEILLYGLNADLDFMHETLSGMVRDIRSGKRFEANNEYEDIVEGHRCRFLEIPVEAYDEYLGTAVRHHGGTWFGALQCVWPDRRQQYPWDRDVEPAVLARQPVLAQRGGGAWSFGAIEKSRWVITTKQVATSASPTTLVSHDSDGWWQFLSSDASDDDALVACIGNLVDGDPTLHGIADLQPGESATRADQTAPWLRRQAND